MLHWIIIILCVGYILAVLISLFNRIIKDNQEYRRNKPKVKAQPFTDAQITVTRRENSSLTSLDEWDFFLNGENIGRIKDGESITIETDQRINELKAKDSIGFERQLKFYVESSSLSLVVFNEGRFQNPRGMNVIMPSDEGFKKIARAWIYWAVLLGYYTAVFFLVRGQIALVLSHRPIPQDPSRWVIFLLVMVPLLPLIIGSIFGWRAYRGLVDYLSYNHPEAWGSISRDMHRLHLINNVILLDSEIDDPDYLELKIQYERVLAVQLFSFCVCIGLLIYTIASLAR